MRLWTTAGGRWLREVLFVCRGLAAAGGGPWSCSGLRTYLEGANGPGRGSQVHSHDVLVFLWMSVARRRAWCSYLSRSLEEIKQRNVGLAGGRCEARQATGRQPAGRLPAPNYLGR